MGNQLERWICAQIREQGRVPFVQFMEWALYHPEWGYYTSERQKFGKAGDFYTSPGVNPVFAEVLADEIAKLWQEMGQPTAFSLIEFGAGDGRLARDLLQRWQDRHPALLSAVAYRIVERSPSLRVLQQQTLNEWQAQAVWLTEQELQAGGPYVGIVLTNELVDAFPVHRVIQQPEGLCELYVTLSEQPERPLRETPGPLTTERIVRYLQAYGQKLRQGQIAEVGLAGLDWYASALKLLAAGAVLTIDYGFEAEMLYHPSRRSGTLRGFYQHQLQTDPYAHIGEQDLTTDVNFTALQRFGEEHGYQTVFFGSQTKYLLQADILQRLVEPASTADPLHDPDWKRNRAIRQMILPGGMGDHFKVLLQQKVAPVV